MSQALDRIRTSHKGKEEGEVHCTLPSTAAFFLELAPAHEFLQIDHSARLGQMGIPGGRRFGWLGQSR